MTSKSEAVRVSSIVKDYSGSHGVQRVLDHLDLHLESGQRVAVLGENGAGKSTLLKIASGVTAPTGGVVDRSDRCASVLEVGAAFHPDLTGRENAEAVLAIRGVLRRSWVERMTEVESFAGIGSAIDRPISGYSSGMVARLASALALAVDADLYIIDEVFAVGDSAFQRRILERLASEAERGAAIVVVTHDMTLAERAAERVVWIADGQVYREGPTTEVLAEYAARLGRTSASGAMEGVMVRDLSLSASQVDPGDPVTIHAEVVVDERFSALDSLEIVVECRAIAGTSEAWMRSPNADPADRYLNLVAVSEPVELIIDRPGVYEVEVEVMELALWSTSLDVSVVVRRSDGSQIDSLDERLDIGDQPERPQLRLNVATTSDGHVKAPLRSAEVGLGVGGP